MLIKAFGKINLAIDVKNKDDSGYHNVDIVTVPVTLHDVLKIEPLIGRKGVFITSDDPTLICDEGNLAYKALAAMGKHYPLNDGYRIQIYKRIPVEAGLGGGSADAAGVIRAICKLKNLEIDDPEVLSIARSVGSDVPFCLLNKPARVSGTGEKLQILDLDLNYHVLIIKPHKGLSTKAVYDKFDSIPPEEIIHPDINQLLKGFEMKDEQMVFENMKNSLQKPAAMLSPVIDGILAEFKRMNFPLYAMTGSGNACFALTKEPEKIEMAKKYFTALNYITIVASTDLTNQETIYNSSLFAAKKYQR